MKKGLMIIIALVFVATVGLPAVGYSRGHGDWGYAGAAVGGLMLGTIIGSTMAPAGYYAPPPPPPPYYYPHRYRSYYYPPSPRMRHYRPMLPPPPPPPPGW